MPFSLTGRIGFWILAVLAVRTQGRHFRTGQCWRALPMRCDRVPRNQSNLGSFAAPRRFGFAALCLLALAMTLAGCKSSGGSRSGIDGSMDDPKAAAEL